MAAFATSADMINQYDEGTLADLCSDSGTPASNLATNDKMTAALSYASGTILSFCTVADLYSENDLEGLDGISESLLKSLTCELAITYLLERRPEKWADAAKAYRERAEGQLDRIRRGERVFDVAANRAAGLPTIGGPMAIEVVNQNLITSRAHNFYPGRAGALPLGRG